MQFSHERALVILNALLETGGDYAEIYFQDERTHSYRRRFRKVDGVSSGRTSGIGLRILKNDKTVYGYTAAVSFQEVLSLARNLAKGFDGQRVLTVSELKRKRTKNRNIVRIPHDAWSTRKKLDYLRKGERAAFAYGPSIQDFVGSLYEEDEHIEVYNSEGLCFSDDRVRTRFAVNVTATDGKQFQQGYDAPGLSCGLELLEEYDIEAMARHCAKIATDLLTAPASPSGEMPVVLGNSFGGVLFHEACGHPLEGEAIADQTSPFYDKLGKQIASSCVNAVDDGTIPNGWGTENIDDEGITPTRNQLIKDGVLTNFMLDRLTARKIDETKKPTGCCRRESYRYLPTTRMTNTYIDNGTSDPKDIIASVKDGIYCEDLSGGQVDPSTDKFIFTSTTAYRIKDGKITHLIKPVSLTGYGYEILQRITMVGNDLLRAPGVCGASSGSCFVEVGQPTLLISRILVGGEGGED